MRSLAPKTPRTATLAAFLIAVPLAGAYAAALHKSAAAPSDPTAC